MNIFCLLRLLVIVVACFNSLEAMQQDTPGCFKSLEEVEKYLTNSSLQEQWALDIINKKLIQDFDSVLDIGCGPGSLSASIAQCIATNGNVVGLDISPQMIAKAHATYGMQSNLSFVSQDVELMKYDNEFHAIVECCTLQWLGDQLPALKKMYQALIPGGVIMLTHPGSSPTAVFPLAKAMSMSDGWTEDFQDFVCPRSYYTKTEYEHLLEQAGFVHYVVEEKISVTKYDDVDALKAWVARVSPFVQHLQGRKQEDFLDELVTKILQYSPQGEDGAVYLQSLQQIITAYKSFDYLPD